MNNKRYLVIVAILCIRTGSLAGSSLPSLSAIVAMRPMPDISNTQFMQPSARLFEATPGDVNGDGALNILDILEIMLDFGCTDLCGSSDINNDGIVSILDLQELLLLL